MTTEPTPAAPDADAPDGPTRRRVLAAAAVVGAVGSAGLLAACGDDGGSDDTGSPTGDESRPAGSIASTSDVPVGGGKVVVLDNAKVVVTQPAAGDFKAFSAICTHAGCTVGGVADGLISCPCHGSEFDAATGQVVRAANGMDPRVQSPLAVVDITVTGDTISFA